jgi:hypothetical protein
MIILSEIGKLIHKLKRRDAYTVWWFMRKVG